MAGGHAQHIARIDIQDRQPNGMALGMDHLDTAHQLRPVAAGPNRNQLARAEVHGARVVQTLKVRLACIDAPETAQSPYGMASRNQLMALLPLGSTVSLRVQAVDRYARSVAEVIGKGIVNLAMVQSGQAFVYRQYLGRCDRGAYLAAEGQAQAQRLGVCAVPGGITRPWDFRHGGAGYHSAGAVRAAASSSAPVSSPQTAQPTGIKTTCKQIGSFARAQELLRKGHSSLDRNGDGVACESLR